MTSRLWSGRARVAAIGVLAALVAGCTQSVGGETATPEAAPTMAAMATSARLASVDPAIVSGLDVRVHEDLDSNHLVYAAYPVIPGLGDWVDVIEEDLAPLIDRFVTETAGSAQPPYPELLIGWNLVAASPDVVGVRIHTTEIGPDTSFDGRSVIQWYDVPAGSARPSQDLLADGVEDELIDRVRSAAAGNPVIEPQRLEEHLVGERESFSALAFDPEGQLWIEFSRTVVSASPTPIALAVDADGLLSDFGERAREAALSPRDPALVPEPSPAAAAATTAAGATAPPASSRAPAGGDTDCSVVVCAALTFDDGPVAGTDDLLDVLAEKGVPATFFVVGTNARANPGTIARMVREGHVVGNHTLDHPQLTRLAEADIRNEIVMTNDIVREAAGVTPSLLRPPFGATNDSVSAVAAELDMALVNWNVDPQDWKDRDSGIVAQRVLSSTRNGSIVLSHDIHATTREAYAGIIDELRAEGFTLVTVPDLLDSIEPGVLYYSR